METETQEATTGVEIVDEADQFLSARVKELDTIDVPAPAGDTGAKADDGEKTAKGKTDRVPSKSEKTNGPESGKPAEGKKESSASTLPPKDNADDKSKPRSTVRKEELETEIRGLIEKKKALEAEVAQVSVKKESPAKVEEPVLIQPPQKPQYTVAQLYEAKKKAVEEGDERFVEWVTEEIDRVKRYDQEVRLWKLENGRAFEKFHAVKSHYRNEAIKKWPALSDPTTVEAQTFTNLSSKFPDLLNRPQGDGEYWLGNVAVLIAQGSKVAALEDELKTLKGENDALKGKLHPAGQKTVTATGGQESEGDPDAMLRSGLRSLLPA